MCGIGGIASASAVSGETLSILIHKLQHRGPNGQGSFLSPDRAVGLVHTRLSIIDLSAAGRQPMTNETGSILIVYNGEIYNFRELQQELSAKGHLFKSKTDTEAIIHLYEEMGEHAVARLVGMFAFAIYDQGRQRLVLVRDRLGIKPLYYANSAEHFIFASEIKAILATGLVPMEPDWQAISDYFTFGFVPHPQTAFRHIRQLPPAHILIYDLKTRHSRLQEYWTPWACDITLPRTEGDLKNRVSNLLEESVKSELVSDVPLGLFFSGGIDSSILALLMSRSSSERVKTFTVGFRSAGLRPEEDDLPYARLASQALGTDHHELIVDLTKPEDFIGIVDQIDQPFANLTCYLQYLIAKETRRHVTVALSGVGGDELFGGYPRHRLYPFSTLLRRFPASTADRLRRILWKLPGDGGGFSRRLDRVLKGAGQDPYLQYVRWAFGPTEKEKASLLRLPGLPQPLPADRFVSQAWNRLPDETDLYERFLHLELKTFLADNLLEYTDKMSMAVALEVRVPFLDHRLVELCARIPFRNKVTGGHSKLFLKKLFQDDLPPEILQGPKRGFAPPISQWLDQALDCYFEGNLTRTYIEKQGLFRWDRLSSIRAAHRRKKFDASSILWMIAAFDAWYRRFIEKAPLHH